MPQSIHRRSTGEPSWFSGGRLGGILLFILAMLMFGCASRKQMEMVQEDTQAIRTDVDTLKRQQREALNSLTDLDSQIRDLKTKNEYGSSALQEKVEGLAARLDEILTRMDRSLAPLEEFIRRQSAADTTKPQAMGVDYFDAAMRDLSLGNYDLAEVGFLQYLEAYPKSDLSDDARYGLAETYYARKRWDEAIEEYQRVIAMNPTGGKTPAAMLKLGLSQREKNSPKDAKKVWEDLVKKFPFSEEAKVAQQRLDELKTKK